MPKINSVDLISRDRMIELIKNYFSLIGLDPNICIAAVLSEPSAGTLLRIGVAKYIPECPQSDRDLQEEHIRNELKDAVSAYFDEIRKDGSYGVKITILLESEI